ncbi:MAG: hypothetical protein A3F84_03635 [Candidatus Handelsmanbacteria bacterium RIFCSPLOWO2_12_FULL_64_10]|uniref:RDD domain-containing protein n=1 Tax=Handelsmanbacteria sp. (strain RIFCSPLOWO2_12_FULL_64_10) TaxID=1817868 RepID=A0A1F6C5W5_HANXR|nr:MAG: hypothetical protein A3F84_03635 [Candidatus Handelsmanbacteria bacterium RIFCSPLOWO2_12_FULL_64_10]
MIPGEKAGVRPRAWALLIDLIVLSIIQVVAVALLQGAWIAGFNLLVWIAYSVTFDGGRGATPGKILLGLKIVRTDGSAVDYHQAFVRCLVKVIPLLLFSSLTSYAFFAQNPTLLRAGLVAAGLLFPLLSAIAVARHPCRQAPHDRAARTCVIRLF